MHGRRQASHDIKPANQDSKKDLQAGHRVRLPEDGLRLDIVTGSPEA
jgi:hypothetical protein